jgi:hypothetical protein
MKHVEITRRLAIISSERFHPGHISHIEANSRLLERYGFDVRFSVHKLFLSFPGNSFKSQMASSYDYLQLRSSDLYIVWFPSIKALYNMLLVRLLSSATVVFVYHEPFTSWASYREAGFSWIKVLKILVVSKVNSLMCALSHKVILPSSHAYHALPAASGNPARFAKINLLYSDEARHDQINQPRWFISYIGTIAEDHAFEEFVRLIHASITSKVLLPYKFLIATRSAIPPHLSSLIDSCVHTGRLHVHSGTPMSNIEINHFYSQSFVIWNAYRRSMQSGVLPKAYMFSTPVLVSTSNESEYFEDGTHGILISNRCSLVEFQHAIIRLRDSWSEISRNCRSFYLQNFDHRALGSTFIDFVLEAS